MDTHFDCVCRPSERNGDGGYVTRYRQINSAIIYPNCIVSLHPAITCSQKFICLIQTEAETVRSSSVSHSGRVHTKYFNLHSLILGLSQLSLTLSLILYSDMNSDLSPRLLNQRPRGGRDWSAFSLARPLWPSPGTALKCSLRDILTTTTSV